MVVCDLAERSVVCTWSKRRNCRISNCDHEINRREVLDVKVKEVYTDRGRRRM